MVKITREIIKEKRFYVQGRNKYPGVTSILRYYPKGIGFYRWLASKGWQEAERIKEEAGELGSNVHRIIEKYLKGKDFDITKLTFDEKKSFNTFRVWFNKLREENAVELIDMEKMVINKEVGYGGTIDIILKINNILWILDIKTSKSLWPAHKLQLSAYKHCGYEKAKIGIIHVNHRLSGPLFKEIEDLFDVFLAVKCIYDYENVNN